MVFTKEDMEKINAKNNSTVVKKLFLSIGEYYAKYCTDADAFRELLGKKVFDMVGIKCPIYYYCEEAHCVLSENVNNFDKFFNPFDLGMNGYTMRDIKEKLGVHQLEGRFSNIEELDFQLNLMHFIDILFSNIDRHISNFGFSLREDGSGYLVVFDNAEFLKEFHYAIRPVSFRNSGSLDFIFRAKKEEASNFLEHVSEEEKEYFKKVYELFSPFRLLTLIRKLEKENNIIFANKINTFKSYIKNYMMLGMLLRDNKLLKK